HLTYHSQRLLVPCIISLLSSSFFNAPATTAIYTLSLHDALPISLQSMSWSPMPATSRILRTFVPALIPVGLPLTFSVLITVTVSPSTSTLPTASLITPSSAVPVPVPVPVPVSSAEAVHSCAHAGQTSSAPIS